MSNPMSESVSAVRPRGSFNVKRDSPMSKISPCLWFDGEAEEAAKFYVSLLPDSRRWILTVECRQNVIAALGWRGVNVFR